MPTAQEAKFPWARLGLWDHWGGVGGGGGSKDSDSQARLHTHSLWRQGSLVLQVISGKLTELGSSFDRGKKGWEGSDQLLQQAPLSHTPTTKWVHA